MSKRSTRQPLYDLMKLGPRPTPAQPVQEERSVPEPPLDDPGQSWLTPGRVLRLPVGYLLVAMTIVVVLVVAAYILGHRQGGVAAKAEFEAQFLGRASDGSPMGLRDPLNQEGDDFVASPQGIQAPVDGTGSLGGGASPDPDGGPSGAGWGPIRSDPRQVGVTYFILAETTPAGAERLARFCRDDGLETYVVPSKNTRLRQVVALPGYAGSRTTPQAREIEARIHAIGDRWQRQESGTTNLRDAYPVTHR
ncbi:MAG: hypothetical protein ACYTGG_08625 [Planctomycetota bacterium]